MITDGIVQFLLANPTVSGMTKTITPSAGIKVKVSPYIVYKLGPTVDTLDTFGSTGQRLARFVFDCVSGSNYTEAKALAQAVRKALDKVAYITLPDADATQLQSSLVDFEFDSSIVPTGQINADWRVTVQISIGYIES
jgi:hypothetical protein